jgi:hypothetical protein
MDSGVARRSVGDGAVFVRCTRRYVTRTKKNCPWTNGPPGFYLDRGKAPGRRSANTAAVIRAAMQFDDGRRLRSCCKARF